MPLPRKFRLLYMQRNWYTRQQSNNKVILTKLSSAIRVRQFLYMHGNIVTKLGFSLTPYESADTPPEIGNILIYKNDKAAARNGWIGELGFILVRRGAPTENENNKNEEPNPGPLISQEKSGVYYRFGEDLTDITAALYAEIWPDPIIDGGSYHIRAGTIHQIKHRNTTPYF